MNTVPTGSGSGSATLVVVFLYSYVLINIQYCSNCWLLTWSTPTLVTPKGLYPLNCTVHCTLHTHSQSTAAQAPGHNKKHFHTGVFPFRLIFVIRERF